MTADRTPSLRDQIAQAMRDANGTPEALAAWQRHPQLVPVDVYADHTPEPAPDAEEPR